VGSLLEMRNLAPPTDVDADMAPDQPASAQTGT